MKRLSDTTILMTADAVGGVWTFATSLASALAARGAEVHLVTMGPSPRADQRMMLAGSGVRVIETDLALEWQDPEGSDAPRARDALLALARRIGPDLVHLNSFREATFDWPMPVIVTAHSCVNSWALACGDTSWLSEPRWRSYTGYVAAGLDQADAWVAPTSAFCDTITDLYRPSLRGNVIWNGLPAASARSDKDAIILAAGRMWDAAKNRRSAGHDRERPRLADCRRGGGIGSCRDERACMAGRTSPRRTQRADATRGDLRQPGAV